MVLFLAAEISSESRWGNVWVAIVCSPWRAATAHSCAFCTSMLRYLPFWFYRGQYLHCTCFRCVGVYLHVSLVGLMGLSWDFFCMSVVNFSSLLCMDFVFILCLWYRGSFACAICWVMAVFLDIISERGKCLRFLCFSIYVHVWLFFHSLWRRCTLLQEYQHQFNRGNAVSKCSDKLFLGCRSWCLG